MGQTIRSRRRRRGVGRRVRGRRVAELLASSAPPPLASRTVYLAGKLAATLAPGGGETQLRRTSVELADLGVVARLWRPWEETPAAGDILHLFGSEPEFVALAAHARKRGVRVVLSTIAWFDLASIWNQPGSWWRRVGGSARHLLRSAVPGVPSWRRKLYHAADLLLPNSRVEADQLVELFGVAEDRLHVVPNGADPRFAQGNPEAFRSLVDEQGFVLYAGRIEPRKNQLEFLRAVEGLAATVVILGDTVPGHEAYAAACREAAGPNVRFVGRLEHDDPRLAGAYAAAGCLVLASWFETPGLVALEAAMTGTPLVLPEAGAAPEYFGPLAEYVGPTDRPAIRAAVERALARGRSAELAQHVQERYTWRAAALATRAAYERLR